MTIAFSFHHEWNTFVNVNNVYVMCNAHAYICYDGLLRYIVHLFISSMEVWKCVDRVIVKLPFAAVV